MRSRFTAVAPASPAFLALNTRAAAFARIGLVLVAAIISACVRSAESATNSAESSAIPVVAHPAALSTRAWSTTASGIVYANTTVDVAFEVPGRVANAGPDEGQSVRAGQVIASLDPSEYQLGVEQAGAQAERAVRDRDRSRPLLAAGSISPADLDHLETGARQSIAGADLAKKHLADTRLAAPISGIIARRAIETGAMVSPGQPVYTIVALDPVRIRVGVPESDVGRITEGAAATVRIPALDTSFAGHVSLVGVAADPTTRSFTVEISVPNPAHRLRAGMVAEATITTKSMTSGLFVPSAAVLRDGAADKGTMVYVLDGDGTRAHARRVTTGAARGDSLEISSGLAIDDRVVVAGQQRLREGTRVTLIDTGIQSVEPSGRDKR